MALPETVSALDSLKSKTKNEVAVYFKNEE